MTILQNEVLRALALALLCAVPLASGCANPVEAACNDRCPAEQREGCRDPSEDCASTCYTAGQLSNDLYARASKAGCSFAYTSWESCLIDAPHCSDINAYCAVQLNSLNSCVETFCLANPGAC